MYNILTIASKSYLPFLDIFLNSLITNSDLNKINKIYVIDIDLQDYKNYLIKSDKIQYVSTNLKDSYNGVHSEGWYKNTKIKTEYLLNVLNKINLNESLIMIDSDVFIKNDISKYIDLCYDMQFTTMDAGSHVGASGIEISEIASFLICNNIEKSKIFVKLWIDKIKNLKNTNKPSPHETPAMNFVLRNLEKSKDYNFGYLKENNVCCDSAIYPDTDAIHFKSNGSTELNPYLNFISRITYIKCFDKNLNNLKMNNYLNRYLFKIWKNNYYA